MGFSDLSTPVKAILALAFVLVLVVIAGLLLRKLAGKGIKLPGQSGRARQARLGVVDIFELDRQRQLILLRRDNVEHLVMIGGPNDVVVEASIQRAGLRAPAPPQPEAVDLVEPPTALPPKPKTDFKPELKNEPKTEPKTEPPAPAPAQPPFVEPKVPSPAIGKAAAAAGAVATAAAVAASAKAAGVIDAPDQASPPADIAATASAPVVMTNPAPERPPVLSDDEIAATFEAELAKAAEIAPTPVAAPIRTAAETIKPIIEPIARPADLRASPTELDDMTRQLQEALKRPFSGVKAPVVSEPTPAAPPAAQQSEPPQTNAQQQPIILEPVVDPIPEPVAMEIATPTLPPATPVATPPATPPAGPPIPLELQAVFAPVQTVHVTAIVEEPSATDDFDIERALAAALKPDVAPEPVLAEHGQVADEIVEPAPKAKPVKAAKTAAEPAATAPEPKAEPAPAPTPAKTDPVTPATADPAKAEAKPGDPFSVESIEAEFARLLNRSATPKT